MVIKKFLLQLSIYNNTYFKYFKALNTIKLLNLENKKVQYDRRTFSANTNLVFKIE